MIEFFFQTLCSVTTEKNKILLEVDGFKLHTMVADGKKAKKKTHKEKIKWFTHC